MVQRKVKREEGLQIIPALKKCMRQLSSLFFRSPTTGGAQTCITYDAVNHAYVEARKRISEFIKFHLKN